MIKIRIPACFSARFVLAFCMVTIAGAEARSQTSDLDDDWGPTAGRHSSIPLSGAMRRARQTSDETPTVEPEQSRWERFRSSVWPFKRKHQSDAKADPSVSQAKLESAQAPGDLPTLPPLPSPAPNYTIPAPLGSNSSAPNSDQASSLPDAPLTYEDRSATSDDDTSASSAAAESGGPPAYYEKEPYCFWKRFFRGYDCLVEWFPQHLGPPRKSTPDPRARSRISATNIPPTRLPACPIPRPTVPGLTVPGGTAPRTEGKRRVRGNGPAEAVTSQTKLQGGRRRVPGIRRHFQPRSTRVIP